MHPTQWLIWAAGMFYIRQEVKSKRQRRKCHKVCLVSALIWVISQFQLTKPGIFFLSHTHITAGNSTILIQVVQHSYSPLSVFSAASCCESCALFKMGCCLRMAHCAKDAPRLQGSVVCSRLSPATSRWGSLLQPDSYIFVQCGVKEDIKLVVLRKERCRRFDGWRLIVSRGDRKRNQSLIFDFLFARCDIFDIAVTRPTTQRHRLASNSEHSNSWVNTLLQDCFEGPEININTN